MIRMRGDVAQLLLLRVHAGLRPPELSTCRDCLRRISNGGTQRPPANHRQRRWPQKTMHLGMAWLPCTAAIRCQTCVADSGRACSKSCTSQHSVESAAHTLQRSTSFSTFSRATHTNTARLSGPPFAELCISTSIGGLFISMVTIAPTDLRTCMACARETRP